MSNCNDISGQISNNIKFKIEFNINPVGDVLRKFSHQEKAALFIRTKRKTWLCKKMRAAFLNDCRNKPKLRKSK